ncbi:hypothetical protein ACFPRL_36415 [Pseudoclavibacter helvolus]
MMTPCAMSSIADCSRARCSMRSTASDFLRGMERSSRTVPLARLTPPRHAQQTRSVLLDEVVVAKRRERCVEETHRVRGLQPAHLIFSRWSRWVL